MNTTTNSPQRPEFRPLVPPKPDKDKINTTSPVGKISSGTQANFLPENRIPTTTQNGQDLRQTTAALTKSRSVPSVPHNSANHQNQNNHNGPKSPLIKPSIISPLKPALPPKPSSNSIPSPPSKKPIVSPNPNPKPPTSGGSTQQIFPRCGNSVSIANSILANRGRHSLESQHGISNNNSHHHPPPVSPNRKKTDGCFSEPESSSKFFGSEQVIRRDGGINNVGNRSFNKSTSEPLSPRPTFNNNPRPFSSIFTFPSPETNVTNAPVFSDTILKRHSEIRAKSASLGRNVTPPSSSSGGFFSKKAETLSRILPLDLHFGKKSKPQLSMQQHATSPTSPATSPIQNFGRKISFSTGSAIPPPPPPRLKRKLSPVSSLSPVESISPSSPPPVFSPLVVNPFMTSVQEEESAIYAEVDKEKKWADRKLKQETEDKSVDDVNKSWQSIEQTTNDIQASLVISINHRDEDKAVNVQSHSTNTNTAKMNNNNISSQSNSNFSAEHVIVDSWLGKYLPNPVTTTSKNNLIKQQPQSSVVVPEPDSKTKQSDPAKVIEDLKTQPDSAVEKSKILVANDSFLFKLTHSLNENAEQSSSKETEMDHTDGRKSDTQVLSSVETQEICNTTTTTITNQKHSTETGDNDEKNSLVMINESSIMIIASEEMKDEIPDPDTILHSVDAKIQSAVSLLSNLSGGNSSPIPNKDHLLITAATEEEFESLSISEVDLTKKYNSLTVTQSDVALSNPEEKVKEIAELLSPIENSSFTRRRSWNCSDSSSPCESSSSSVSNLRERAFTYSSSNSKGISRPGWADEGELSTGALADAESSDAPIPTSSTEDMGAAGSISSRRKRLWIFSSFGKGGSASSSGSSNGNQKAIDRKQRHKEKSKSFAPSEANGKSSNTLGRFGRQVSDSVLSTAQVSGPIISEPKSSHPTVQFSPEVDKPIYRYRYSEGSISETAEIGGLNQSSEVEKGGDTESVCSASSANAALGGYEEILAELSPKDKKSFYVAREILSSESTFVDVLDLLTVEFPNAIKEAEEILRQPILPPHEIDGILGGLSNLKRVNEELLIDLQDRIKMWRENPKLADIIVKKGPFLKLYAHYIKNFEKITRHLDSCCERYPLFAKALLDFEMSDRCQKLGLKHYMLKPVQRMPQYRLLLEDYLKNLDEGSSDYQDSIKAIAIVRDVAEHANEAIRLQVNAEKLMHLQTRLIGAVIMKADRQLLKEGELMKVCRKGLQPRFFALMNDCLMCMTYNVGGGTDLKLRYDLPLAGMRVCLTAIEDHPNEFSVISVARSFNLVAKSPREREDWMKCLDNAIHNNIKKRTCTTPDQEIGFQLGKIAPVWIQDGRVTMCMQCTAEFTVTFRRHHCRACGKVVCGHCSGNQAPLQYLKNDAARVCDECYQYLLEEFDRESRENNSDGLETSRDGIRIRFKKVTPNVSKRAAKIRRTIPSRLEVHANNSGSRISNYLHWRERKAWKRHWFVLMDRVLYIYAASEDIVAVRSIPVLGWKVDYETTECMEGGDSQAVFKLTHEGTKTLLFQAEKPALAERWIAAMKEATVLT